MPFSVVKCQVVSGGSNPALGGVGPYAIYIESDDIYDAGYDTVMQWADNNFARNEFNNPFEFSESPHVISISQEDYDTLKAHPRHFISSEYLRDCGN